MRCKDFNRLLNGIDVPERSPALSFEMDAHRAGCRRCAEVWEAEQLLRAIVVPPLPPTLLERICEFVDEVAAGKVVAFPVRRTIVVAGLVLVAAAAAATATVKLFDIFDRAPDRLAVMPTAEDPPDVETDRPLIIETPMPAPIAAAEAESGSAPIPGPARDPATEPDSPTAPVAPAVESVTVPITVDVRTGTAPSERAEPEAGETTVAEAEVAEGEVAKAEVAEVTEPTAPATPAESPPGDIGEIEMGSMLADLRSAADPAAVDALGETFLNRMRNRYGDASRQFAAAQMLLAEEYRKRGEVADAENHLVGGINTLYAAGAAQTEFVDPFLALGDLYEQAGDHAGALAQYARARDIIRRVEGVLTPEQIRMVDRITNAYLAADEIESAREVQLEARDLVHRTAGGNSVESLEATYRYASWIRSHLGTTRRIQNEIEDLYSNALQVIDEHFVDSDPQQAVHLLESLGQQALSNDGPGNRLDEIGVGALRRAQSIAEDIALDDPLLRALIERHLGDWAVIYGDKNQVDYYYGNAFEFLGSLPDGDSLRDAWFAELHVIQQAPIDSPALSDDPAALPGYVEVAFTLDMLGSATDIETLSADPRGLVDDAARVAVSRSRFRPRLTADGKLTPSSASYFMHFRYDPAARPAR
jgi:hypothetical protein